MHYFIAIELPKKGEDTAYGVVVPDIPGCFSAGDTLDEAIVNAEEAIVLQLEDMIERNLELPEPSCDRVPSYDFLIYTPRVTSSPNLTRDLTNIQSTSSRSRW